ncbi:M13 family metallopeptidase [Mucilaginibacter myungsuensis]|uniref:M13 family metallopeptidase n=1 Tax=Mucilaginibacter myungsuensis TaxID=649104 RepID=A0A929KSZ8_9SPHI|nr:M13 family metallopeptidase [Mucilaginibacter myungsuensis]MBE9660984.1 M13 family metallopeptidase [Mucilaginibacter myungsuensis]MDN3601030.1 M13 family metallopeptidase [Mucilaginibacter myungsuensis]
MKYSNYLWLAIPAVIATGCGTKPDAASDVPKRTVFFDKSAMDTTISPGNDFYNYASGAWLKKTEIPASETGWGSFYTLFDDNTKNLHKILEETSAGKHDEGSLDQKVGDLYASGMDTVAIEKLGYTPIKPLLAKIAALQDYKALVNFAAASYKDGDGYLFGFYVGPDDKNSTKNMAQFGQTGISLPNRDYYLEKQHAEIKAKYEKYVAQVFTLIGDDAATAAKKAAEVVKLETEIAKSHKTPVELRDPQKNYNKFLVADLQKRIPDIDLKNVLDKMDVKTDTVLVGQPGYYVALNGLLKSQPIDTWKKYLQFKTVNGSASYLSKAFRDARFDFFGKTLNGQKVQKERWKSISYEVDGGIGELLGQLYVAKYFTPEAKTRMLDLVNNLQGVYKERIEKLDWMSNETKDKAKAKLASFVKKIGYPDTWKKYDDVNITRTAYYDNMQSISKHNYAEQIKKVDQKVDKTEWGMTPPTVNAYYNPSFNEIVFPAGILQFPFFDKDADDAINYGAIGAVIGHEMTHGFDDQGAQYDKDGNLKNWWSKTDETKFKAKTQVVVDQYNKFEVFKGLNVNGALTQGENIADIGGLTIAYNAFKNTAQGKSDTKIDGLTPDQRFFLAYAQVWRIKTRDETMKVRLSSDPHSPEMYRVNGPLSNMPEFYKAFGVKPGDKLYREEKDRVKIW